MARRRDQAFQAAARWRDQAAKRPVAVAATGLLILAMAVAGALNDGEVLPEEQDKVQVPEPANDSTAGNQSADGNESARDTTDNDTETPGNDTVT